MPDSELQEQKVNLLTEAEREQSLLKSEIEYSRQLLSERWEAIREAFDLPVPKEPAGAWPVGSRVTYKGQKWTIDLVKRPLRIARESESVCAYRIVRKGEDGKEKHDIVPHEMVIGPGVSNLIDLLGQFQTLYLSIFLGAISAGMLRQALFGENQLFLTSASPWAAEQGLTGYLSSLVCLRALVALVLPFLCSRMGYGRVLFYFSILQTFGCVAAFVFWNEVLDPYKFPLVIPAFMVDCELGARSAYLALFATPHDGLTSVGLLVGTWGLGRIFGEVTSYILIGEEGPGTFEMGFGILAIVATCLAIGKAFLMIQLEEPGHPRPKVLLPMSLRKHVKFDELTEASNTWWFIRTYQAQTATIATLHASLAGLSMAWFAPGSNAAGRILLHSVMGAWVVLVPLRIFVQRKFGRASSQKVYNFKVIEQAVCYLILIGCVLVFYVYPGDPVPRFWKWWSCSLTQRALLFFAIYAGFTLGHLLPHQWTEESFGPLQFILLIVPETTIWFALHTSPFVRGVGLALGCVVFAAGLWVYYPWSQVHRNDVRVIRASCYVDFTTELTKDVPYESYVLADRREEPDGVQGRPRSTYRQWANRSSQQLDLAFANSVWGGRGNQSGSVAAPLIA